MHKVPRRDKRGRPIRGTARPQDRRGGAHSVKQLLERATPSLTRVTVQAKSQSRWREWISTRLAPELDARVCGVIERESTLTVLVSSSAWCARLRYALCELESELLAATAPHPLAWRVRVMPPAGRPG